MEDQQSLLDGFHNSREEALRKFWKQHFRPLAAYACRILHDEQEAEDIVVEAIDTIWKQRMHFENVGQIVGTSYLEVRHRSFDLAKKRKRAATTYGIMEHLADEVPEENTYSLFRNVRLHDDLYKAINELPPQSREIIKLFFFKGKSVNEIAALLGLKQNTVSTQKRRGLDKLKELLKDHPVVQNMDMLILLLFLLAENHSFATA